MVRPTGLRPPSPRRRAYSRSARRRQRQRPRRPPRQRGRDMALARRRALPRWITITTLGLSLLAVGLTAYLTVTHYTDPTALACPDTGIVNCTLVTTSSWSVLFGVPLAVLGLVWAVVMTALTTPWAWR